jgi:C4-dicarboxylate-specific signal transduction histidine kinase
MASIVSGLRSFARDGRADPVEPVDVAVLIHEVAELARSSHGGEDIQLLVGTVPPGLVVGCRRTEVGQVLVNLLANAFDAVKPLQKRWIEMGVSDLGTEVEFAVTDSGSGIAPELLDKIMNPFFTTKTGAGTGLGLSISRSIAEQHHGSLTVDARFPNTRFIFRLPKVAPPTVIADRPVREARPS